MSNLASRRRSKGPERRQHPIPSGHCPKCKHDYGVHAWATGRPLFECGECGMSCDPQKSPTAKRYCVWCDLASGHHWHNANGTVAKAPAPAPEAPGRMAEEEDMQGYIDRLVQQDDLIKRQRKALVDIHLAVSNIPEIGATINKAKLIELKATLRAIRVTAQGAL